MRITKWGEYGILSAMYMARSYEENLEQLSPVGAAELAFAHEIPLQYAQQILQRLRKGYIIQGVKGPGGGYLLARNPEDISLREILEASEGDTFEIICDSNSIYSRCSNTDHSCNLKPVWFELKGIINDYLEGKTLRDLLNGSVAENTNQKEKLIILSQTKNHTH